MNPETLQQAAEAAALNIFGTGNDRIHDRGNYYNGYVDGANYILSSTESVEEKPKWTVRVSITLSHGKRDMTFDFDEFPSKETIEAEVHEFCRIHHVGQRNGYSIYFGEPILLTENRLPTLKRSSRQAGCAVWVKALRDLVYLKDYKDANGKDEIYEREQPLAWEAARKALLEIDNEPYESLTQYEQGKEAKMKDAE